MSDPVTLGVYRQRDIPRRFTVEELFDDVTRALGAT
jgi:hypothetical protein